MHFYANLTNNKPRRKLWADYKKCLSQYNPMLIKSGKRISLCIISCSWEFAFWFAFICLRFFFIALTKAFIISYVKMLFFYSLSIARCCFCTYMRIAVISTNTPVFKLFDIQSHISLCNKCDAGNLAYIY